MSLRIASGGVPFGTHSPYQVEIYTPGAPASSTVALALNADDPFSYTPDARSLPFGGFWKKFGVCISPPEPFEEWVGVASHSFISYRALDKRLVSSP